MVDDDDDKTCLMETTPPPVISIIPRNASVVPLEALSEWPNEPRTVGAYELIGLVAEMDGLEIYLAHRQSEHGVMRRALLKRAAAGARTFVFSSGRCSKMRASTRASIIPTSSRWLDVIADEGGVSLALEHADGTSLERVNTILRARHQAFPFELAGFILAEALRGLHQAHVQKTHGECSSTSCSVILRRRTFRSR